MKLNRNGWITSSPAAGSDSSDDEEVEHLKRNSHLPFTRQFNYSLISQNSNELNKKN